MDADKMDRREFIGKATVMVGAAMSQRVLGAEQAPATAPAMTRPAAESPLLATDMVTLGRTGIRTSRLAMGTGTRNGRNIRALGHEGVVKLLRHGLDSGVVWWDLADSYETHPFARAALKDIKRDKVVINTKVRARDAEGVRNDMERFFKELDTDYIDIVLLHCLKKPDWRKAMTGAMDVLREYKEKRRIRAVGVSCHTFVALQAAAEEPWVEVCLARFNPFAKLMEVKKPERIPQVAKVLKKMHENGKVIYGMKILGEGFAKTGAQIDESLRFALQQRWMTAFTIGMNNTTEVDDIIRRIKCLQIRA